MNLSKLAYFILTAVLLTVLGLYLNSKFSGDTPSEKQIQPDVAEPSKPKARVATRPEPSQPSEPIPEAPAKPLSVIAGEDDALILEAKEVLRLAAGPERTAKWQQLVDRGEFFHLVRLTEIPAQPALDADRIALRYLAVQKLGQQGKLGDLIRQREKLDKKLFSKVQFMAWEEWAKIAPATAVGAWHERFTRSEPNSVELAAWNKIFTKGLAAGNPQEAAAAIKQLPEREQTLLTGALAESQAK